MTETLSASVPDEPGPRAIVTDRDGVAWQRVVPGDWTRPDADSDFQRRARARSWAESLIVERQWFASRSDPAPYAGGTGMVPALEWQLLVTTRGPLTLRWDGEG